MPDFSDATLVILGHGSTKNAQSSAVVCQHAAELRRRKIFAGVREAFWKQEPQVRRVLEELRAPRVYIVPLFISEGWFASQVIPPELGFGADESKRLVAGTEWVYCKPIGAAAGLADLILSRAGEVIRQFPFPRPPKAAETTLFVAGHGTQKNENSRRPVDQQVERIRNMNLYAAVHGIFLEEEPRIGACYTLAQTKNMIVVPFFVSEGMHTQEDIPVLLGEPRPSVQRRLAEGRPSWRNPTGRNGRLVWYASPVGTAPGIADLILEQVSAEAVESRGEHS